MKNSDSVLRFGSKRCEFFQELLAFSGSLGRPLSFRRDMTLTFKIRILK